MNDTAKQSEENQSSPIGAPVLTAADLYAPTKPNEIPVPSSVAAPLVYEETPIIEPIPDTSAASAQEPTKQKETRRSSIAGVLLKAGLFVGLFALGMVASMAIRNVLPSDLDLSFLSKPKPTPTPPASGEPTETPREEKKQEVLVDAIYADWKTYTVVSAKTKQPIEGIRFKLPPTVSDPTCDGNSCASQGTDLPGGTRLTIAPRGKGQIFADVGGKILTDASGKEFVMKQTAIEGIPGTEFLANFNGRTGGGYSFSKMRGFIVPVSADLAIEFNHFTPGGKTVDFAKDDELFDRIVKSLTIEQVNTSLMPTSTTSNQ